MKYILSYPRSGNHLIRFITEFITGGYTQGCIGNVKDIPIFNNTFSDETVLSHVDNNKEVAIKAHSLEEVRRGINRSFTTNGGILSCIRNPFFCISSHMRNDKNRKETEFSKLLLKQISNWDSLFEQSYLSEDTTVLWYEDLLCEKTREFELAKIATFFKDNLNIEKYTSICIHSNYYFDISSGGTGRSWGGSESLDDKFHHIKSLSPENENIFLNTLKEHLEKKILSLQNKRKKFPKIEKLKYLEKLDCYIKEINLYQLKKKQ